MVLKKIKNKLRIIIRNMLFYTINRIISKLVFKKNKVNFLIIGAQKAGTTSLSFYLSQHPNCIEGFKKEIHYFDANFNYIKAEKWYHRQFNMLNIGKLLRNDIQVFEATPDYLFIQECPERIYNYNPNCKLIIMLRDPIYRAYSSYNMWMQYRELNAKPMWKKINKRINGEDWNKAYEFLFGNESHTFDYWVDREIDLILNNKIYNFPYFVKRGIYVDQINEYLKYFPIQNILVIEDVELKDHKIQTLDKVAKFLDLRQIKWEEINLDNIHTRKYNQPIDNKTQVKLKEFYKPYDKKLYDKLQKPFGWMKNA